MGSPAAPAHERDPRARGAHATPTPDDPTIAQFAIDIACEPSEPGLAPYDIDVLLLGRPDRDEVYDTAQRAQQRLGREVNVTMRTRKQWENASDSFTRNVRSSPMVEVPYPADRGEVEHGK